MTNSALTPSETERLPHEATTTIINPETSGTPAATADVTTATTSSRPTNVLGVITLVLGVLGFAIIPVITGHIALNQIKRTGDDGRGITLVGLILGYVGLAGYALVALFFAGALLLGAVHASGAGYYR